MSEEKTAEKIVGTVLAVFFSLLSAYDIYGAISENGRQQVVLLALAIMMACCANHYVKIMLRGDE